MATGNGYYAEGKYQAKSTETWADLTNGWDTYSDSWNLTPSLPLEFTTDVIDFQIKDTVNPLTTIDVNGVATTTIFSGDTVDSAGGAIDSPASVSYDVGDTVSAIEARYFQFKVSVDDIDSVGAEGPVYIGAITTNLSIDKITLNKSSLDSSTLSGSLGIRQLTSTGLSSVDTAVITPHNATASGAEYVDNDDSAGALYVEEGDSAGGGYIEPASAPSLILPHIAIDKSTTPMTLYIRDLNTYGKTAIDCTFDAVLTGLPTASVDDEGNIVEG